MTFFLPRVFTTGPAEPGRIVGALLGVAGDHTLHQAAVGRAAGLRLPVVDPLHPARLVVVEEHVVAHVQFVITQNESPVKITKLNLAPVLTQYSCLAGSRARISRINLLSSCRCSRTLNTKAAQITPHFCFITMYLPGEILRNMDGASF